MADTPVAPSAPDADANAASPTVALVGRSPAMRALYEQMRRVAPTEATVLIVGESGSGKERVAEGLHALSRRADRPFVAVNCGAISPSLIEAELLGHEKGSFTGAERQRAGYFERADGGTIFLDEITEMPLPMQVKLLRVLESRTFQRVGGSLPVTVDVRVLAATNRDVERAVRDGRFREDLMYRLAVFPLSVPSLRERGDDVLLLAEHFLDELNQRAGTRKTFSRRLLAQLRHQTWTGNVRELKNAVSRAFILGDDTLEAPSRHDLAGAAAASAASAASLQDGRLRIGIGAPLADAEQAMIVATLDHHGGDKRLAAQTLGISLKTLYNRLESYRGGSAPAGRESPG
ncbi:sigma-54 dependent transcriptional regulator [Nevskia sp.]|uniref:sigma-54 interaction domain-containing protein n=1 Tax=Nevskia sp. TaxID=1929292 RepID=UPI0025F24BE3|nr:sigma-54 dependent transcriptional regulator [Nevskia sp.]